MNRNYIPMHRARRAMTIKVANLKEAMFSFAIFSDLRILFTGKWYLYALNYMTYSL